MKMMKKILSGLLLLLMLVSILGVTAGAADVAGTVAAAAAVGEDGALSLVITADEATVSGRLTVEYDSGLMTYAGVEVAGTTTSVTEGDGSVTFGYAVASSDAIAEGSVIATVNFTSSRQWKYTQLTVTVEDFNRQEGVHLQLPVVEAGDATLPFTDVQEGLWYYDAVKYVYAQGLFQGVTDTTFGPNYPMSRAMFVTVLGRMAGVAEDYPGETRFTDVKADRYYAGYVAWAVENGIVLGTSETTFSPNASVTREQMVTMLYRYANYLGMDTTGSGDALNQFPDASDVSTWAEAAMAWATDRGIINGTEKGLLPRATATRAQCAQIWMKFGQY